MTLRELMKIDIRTIINIGKRERLDCIVVNDTLIGRCNESFSEYLDYKVKEVEVKSCILDKDTIETLSIAYLCDKKSKGKK